MKPWRIGIAVVVLLVLGWGFRSLGCSRLVDKKTVAERLAQYGERARARLKSHFAKAGVNYPPSSVIMAAFKDSKQLQLYARDLQSKPRFIRAYPILASSGQWGPKLREGDQQVPEGIYPIESLNPNSRFHLSLRVGYPNAFDREQARLEGRTNLGGDIMIHGKAVSIGCLAMGDEAAEELFVLAADSGLPNITVILSPTDFRLWQRKAPPAVKIPPWSPALYEEIETRLKELPVQ